MNSNKVYCEIESKTLGKLVIDEKWLRDHNNLLTNLISCQIQLRQQMSRISKVCADAELFVAMSVAAEMMHACGVTEEDALKVMRAAKVMADEGTAMRVAKALSPTQKVGNA